LGLGVPPLFMAIQLLQVLIAQIPGDVTGCIGE
jgi:hypothetical protein